MANEDLDLSTLLTDWFKGKGFWIVQTRPLHDFYASSYVKTMYVSIYTDKVGISVVRDRNKAVHRGQEALLHPASPTFFQDLVKVVYD